jgi:hypothetical protein
VEGFAPGHVFQGEPGQTIELEVGLTLSTRDKIRYVEIVKNGRTEFEANLEDWKNRQGRLPPVKFSESGWFLERAVTELSSTYRFATTGAYFVEIGGRPRISRSSVQFFVDWTNRRAAEIAGGGESIATGYITRAQAWWQSLLERANAD